MLRRNRDSLRIRLTLAKFRRPSLAKGVFVLDLTAGDVVRLKKPHPCGGYDWEVLRVGADFRVRCIKCARMLMLPRAKFEKGVKTVVSRNTKNNEVIDT